MRCKICVAIMKCPRCKKVFQAGGTDIKDGKWISYRFCTHCKKYYIKENNEKLTEIKK